MDEAALLELYQNFGELRELSRRRTERTSELVRETRRLLAAQRSDWSKAGRSCRDWRTGVANKKEG